MVHLIDIAELPDPANPGFSYRQTNARRIHGIPLGTLVEVVDSGVRLFVRGHARDCDQTPLYVLAADMDDSLYLTEGMYGFRMHPGYSESALKVVHREVP